MFKHLPLQSWLDYCQKDRSPGLRAVTNAQRGTPEWDAMTACLQEFINELAVVTNSAESIQLTDLKGAGDPPYIPLWIVTKGTQATGPLPALPHRTCS
ncbi:MAG TPA: hypothetical protein VEH27_13700 [Methylomirabilota bacterium]|nr:hypothetical protein [Methylomirabilota bacterium]